MSTYTPIASQTLSSAAASVTFSGIPQNYTDLVVVCNFGTSQGSNDGLLFRVNGDTGSNYSLTRLTGDGSNASSTRQTSSTSIIVGGVSGVDTTTVTIYQLMSYSNTTTYKTILARNNHPASLLNAGVGLWRNTAAITSITLSPENAANLRANSTFNLYGIDASLSAQAKATGGTTIIRDSSYWYHVFTGSGTFTPTQAITADVLTIAGGAGGGAAYGGGGGAGGLVYSSSQALTANAYTVTVGAGGVGNSFAGSGGSVAGPGQGSNGSSSQFGSLTAATGGGGGGRYYDSSDVQTTRNGANGGSGGGGGAGTNSSFTGTGGTGSQGSNGGGGKAYGDGINSYRGGGGGGYSSAGSSASNSGGGAGGAGSSTYSSWGSATYTGQLVSGTYYYAGGGGGGNGGDSYAGGAGGNGGGGTGGNNASGVAGTANTGGGGGGYGNGGASANAGGNGGSGIVIIRYAV